MQLLDAEELQQALKGLPLWSLDPLGPALFRKFLFDDFAQAFAFMTQVAIHAERLNHHPQWCNVYNSVEVTLTTHDLAGISGKDIEMAHLMDAIVQPSPG